jgi:D-sedoheptulose 7-phosphate isomerase
MSRATDNGSLGPVSEIASTYVRALEGLLHELDLEALSRVVSRLEVARASGRTVYLAGNGGSAATASHWVNDLVKATRCAERRPFRAVCLSDSISLLTALANDEGYERAFSGQLENLGERGDVLVVISASGNSPNLVSAVQLAVERGLVTIGLLGFDGGALRSMLDEYVWIRTDPGAYGLVESAHSIVCDIVTTCLVESTAGDLPETVRVEPVST